MRVSRGVRPPVSGRASWGRFSVCGVKAAIFGLLVALWPVALAGTIGALAERYWPWRKQLTDWLRWLHASILFVVGTLISNLALPVGHTGIALLAAERHRDPESSPGR
jgi:hypothetical protein